MKIIHLLWAVWFLVAVMYLPGLALHAAFPNQFDSPERDDTVSVPDAPIVGGILP